MTVASQIADDYAHREDIQTVTLTRTTGATVSDVKAHREDLSFREGGAGGPVGIEPGDMVWVLWSATLSSATPVTGDKISDAGGVDWTIVALMEHALGAASQWWRCICRKQVT